jgi:hypothetical protein
MNVRAAQVRIYVDADILALGKILAGLRNDVTYPGDPGAVIHKRQRAPCPIASPDVLDSDWIPQVAARGWLIITRDSMIIQNRNEIAAVRENKAKMVAPQPAGRADEMGPARSVHDPVAPYRGARLGTRPVHLGCVAHLDDFDRARLACARNHRMTQIGETIWSGKPSRQAEARLLSAEEMTHIEWDRTSVKTERCVLGDPGAWPLSPASPSVTGPAPGSRAKNRRWGQPGQPRCSWAQERRGGRSAGRGRPDLRRARPLQGHGASSLSAIPVITALAHL